MNHTKIVIIGGGFAAVKCARTLRNRLSPDECQIVVYSRENHMVFHPLLADVAGASIHPDSAAATIRQMLPGVECSTETVERIDIPDGQIEFQNEQGQLARTNYDHLVIACGAESNLGIIPGMSDHAFPFKTMRDAVALRSHIIDQLEKAEACSDPQRRQFHLSFVILGAGFSGVELAGEVNDLVRDSARFYRNFTESDIGMPLVHHQDHILPEVSPTLRDFALKKMQRAGIKVLLKTSAAAANPEGVGLQDGSLIRAATVVCTIGTTASPIIQHLVGVKKERGRVVTDPDMRLAGLPNVWAVGDCAYITNAFDNKPSDNGPIRGKGGTPSSRKHCASATWRTHSSLLFQASRPAVLDRGAPRCCRDVWVPRLRHSRLVHVAWRLPSEVAHLVASHSGWHRLGLGPDISA